MIEEEDLIALIEISYTSLDMQWIGMEPSALKAECTIIVMMNLL